MQVFLANIGTISALIAAFTIAAIYGTPAPECLAWGFGAYAAMWNVMYALKV